MSAFSDALAALRGFAEDTASDPALYPITATLTPDSGAAPSTARLALTSSLSGEDFSAGGEGLTRNPNDTLAAVFPPGVVVRQGDTLEFLSPADVAGQRYEVVPPIRPDSLGYRAGLSFQGGTR